MIAGQPVSAVRWIPRDRLSANSWNPNIQAPPEHKLLKVSLLENGWTQPIVTRPEDGGHEIVDGYHRWLLSADRDVAAMTTAPPREALEAERARLLARVSEINAELAAAGDHAVTLVPVVSLAECPPDAARMATIRHNRARGTHAVVKMADIVAELQDLGVPDGEIGRRLQMDDEEVERLADRGQMTKRGRAAKLGTGWTV
jgi:ParB-like chromosome segregation protein Spo0J